MVLVEELMTAIKTNDCLKVGEFLNRDSSLANASLGGNSAILTAAYYGAKDVVNLLIQNGAELSFFEAAAVGRTEAVLSFLKDEPELVNTYSHDGFTALGLAAFFGYPDIVSELVARRADVNSVSRNPLKVTPLHSAVAHKELEISKILISNGADVNAKQQEGFTPLLEAVQNVQIDMIKLLIENGANINLPKDDEKTPLAMAKETGNAEVIDLLIKSGAIL